MEPDHFTPDHARLAVTFADQVAIAVENARLYEEVRELAVTPPLTELCNRRGFADMEEREAARDSSLCSPRPIWPAAGELLNGCGATRKK